MVLLGIFGSFCLPCFLKRSEKISQFHSICICLGILSSHLGIRHTMVFKYLFAAGNALLWSPDWQMCI